MRLNANTCLRGQHLILIPYRRECVPTYHDWMQSPFLQEMTASEPLSLEMEYEMQRSWLEDETKLTFIILHPQFQSPHPQGNIKGYGGMIGDVNLYLQEEDSDDNVKNRNITGEIEVMIAEEAMRGQGLAGEAVQIMMEYSRRYLQGLGRFVAKISEKNLASQRLFSGRRLKFRQVSISAIFQEITYQFDWDIDVTNDGDCEVLSFTKEPFP